MDNSKSAFFRRKKTTKTTKRNKTPHLKEINSTPRRYFCHERANFFLIRNQLKQIVIIWFEEKTSFFVAFEIPFSK